MEKNKQKFKLKLKERREKAKEVAKEGVIDVTVAENEFEGEEKNMTPPPSPPKMLLALHWFNSIQQVVRFFHHRICRKKSFILIYYV